ncbi:ABC transporter ATP-binding protein [Pumilibacter intestinalis]|uniref:ABC transporter ATP-binding protein n=1 Tax=Pumilibacter intestinalis TaxID=2941511 RepID=UPI00203F02DC|nr:ABC transporter ATP-binding protein [Pumilibacter intestinalis]
MKKLLRFLRGYRAVTVLGPFFKLLEAVGELIIPLVVAAIIDKGITAGDTAYVWKMGGVMLALGAAGLAFAVTAQYMAAKASQGFGTNLRGALYRHINRLSLSDTDRFGAAGLLTRINSDTIQAQVGVAMFIRLVLRSPFLVVGALVMAISISPKISIIFLIMAVIVSVILYIVMSRTSPYYRKIQNNLDEVSLLTRETLSGARVVRAFSNRENEERDFYESADSLKRKNVKATALAALLNPLTYAVINFAIIAVLYFGGKTVNAGGLSQGDVIALVNYLSQILLALVVTANLAVTFTKASASAGRINEVFETKPSIEETATECPAPIEGSVALEFKNVSFAYYAGGREALKNIDFTLNSGETLGVIGSTGSGKSTVANLIPRFYEATEGEILVNGVNVKNYPFADLRRKIGLVPQKAVLFSGTLRENLLFGNPNATDEELYAALEAAQSLDFVQKLPDGLNSKVSRGGRNFSGGQRQRLTVARALAAKPEILILDDSSSALDYATESKMRHAIEALPFSPAVILISQRAFSLMHANKILVLEDGGAAGYGSHEELLESCEVYKEICDSQTKTEKGGANR